MMMTQGAVLNNSGGDSTSIDDHHQYHNHSPHPHHPNPAMASTSTAPRRGKRNDSKRHSLDNALLSSSHSTNTRSSPGEYDTSNNNNKKYDNLGGSGHGHGPVGQSPGRSPGKRQLGGVLTRFIMTRPVRPDNEGGSGSGSGSGDTCNRMTDDDMDGSNGNNRDREMTVPVVSPQNSRGSWRSPVAAGQPRTPVSTTGSVSSLTSLRLMPFRRSTMDSTTSNVSARSGGGGGSGRATSPGPGQSGSFASSAASASSSNSRIDTTTEQPSSNVKRGSLLTSATSVLASSRNLIQKQTSMVLPRRGTNDSFPQASNHGTISVGGSVGMSASIHRRSGNHVGKALRRGSNSSGSVVLFGGGNSVVEELPYELKQEELQKHAKDLHRAGHIDEAIELWVEALDLAEKNRETLATRTEILCILMDLHFQLSEQRKQEEQESLRVGGLSSGSTAVSGPSIYDDDVEYKDCYEENINDSHHKMGYGTANTSIPSAVTASIQPNSVRRRSSSSVSLGLDADPLDNHRGSFHCITREDSEFHRQSAKRYAHRLKPAMVKSCWIECTSQLMNFLTECEAWELALVVAEKLIQDAAHNGQPKQVGPAQLAPIHYNVASQKLRTQRQGEALQHLQATVKNLQQVSINERDMDLYLQVLQLLATEYETQDMPRLALISYAEELKYASTERQAHICCQMAEIFIAEKQLDLALEKLDESAKKVKEMGTSAGSEDAQGTIRRQLLHTKGDVYFRLGRFDESMLTYQQALSESKYPAEKAKLLYTMGRLCIRLRRTRDAITCFTRELEITQHQLGFNHMSVSRIYHELAKLYDEGLGEHKMALMKYNKALQIELGVLQECQSVVGSCQKCNPVTHRMCEMHANMHTAVSNQIRETKKCQGRMHFKLGDFDKAFKASFMDQHRPSSGKRRRGRRQSGNL
mmetsp:Transcript_52770/g.127927  ORF Transcript_52770/g.127927 Transcript_52770/m.127927 type:complete len:922 (-) Transcript_52770:97-2862(-)